MAAPIELVSLGAVAKWIDQTVTAMLQDTVASHVQAATEQFFPIVGIGLSISLAWYGWLVASQAINVPVFDGLRKIVNILVVVNIAGAGGLYQTQIVGLMLDLPNAMVEVLADEPMTPSEALDKVANQGAEVSTRITERAPDWYEDMVGAFAFVAVSIVVTVISAAFTAVGTILLCATKLGMALCVIIGPLVILGLLFETTKDFFQKWLTQVAYYALYAAFFTLIFTVIMGMFGMLQKGLIDTTKANELNIFSMLTAIVIFVMGAIAMVSQVSVVVGAITGGKGSGIPVPFIGRIG